MGECLWNITLFWTNIKLSPIKKTHQKPNSDVPYLYAILLLISSNAGRAKP